MRLKKLLLVFTLFMTTLTTTMAKETPSYTLIYSKDLPYFLLVQETDQNMQVNFINRNSLLPMKEKAGTIALDSIDLEANIDVALRLISDFYGIEIDHRANIHMDELSKEYNLPLSNYDFHEISSVTDFFQAIKEKLDMRDILHYNTYIDANLNLMDYYDYYRKFQKNIDVHFAYPMYLYSELNMIPMDTNFYEKK